MDNSGKFIQQFFPIKKAIIATGQDSFSILFDNTLTTASNMNPPQRAEFPNIHSISLPRRITDLCQQLQPPSDLYAGSHVKVARPAKFVLIGVDQPGPPHVIIRSLPDAVIRQTHSHPGLLVLNQSRIRPNCDRLFEARRRNRY